MDSNQFFLFLWLLPAVHHRLSIQEDPRCGHGHKYEVVCSPVKLTSQIIYLCQGGGTEDNKWCNQTLAALSSGE